MSIDNFVIVQDHPNMLQYVDHLQRKNAEALSFYPLQVFEREKQKGRIFLGILNNEPCGYLYIGAGGGDLKCHQVCIEYDARRKLYGAAMVVVMEEYAKNSKSNSITLRCGFDLDANKFWQEMGFGCINIIEGGIRRKRKINIWRKYLTTELFEPQFIEPVRGKTDASYWLKHKQTGIISSFNRGKKLNDYKILLLNQNNNTEPDERK